MVSPDVTTWPVPAGPAASVAPTLRDWAADSGGGRPRLCLVTGPAGAGKTRLLAWLLAGSRADPRITIHAVGFAEGQVAETVAWQIGRHLGYGPLRPAELIDRVGVDARPLLLLIPDLHKAGRGPADLPSATPAAVVAELIAPLLQLPNVRAAVEIGDHEILDDDGALVLALGPALAGGPADPGPRQVLPPGTDWRAVPSELRELVLDRALETGDATPLLLDPGFLAYGSVPAITATLADDRLALPPRLRSVWHLAAPVLSSPDLNDSERPAVLHAAALGHDPKLAEFIRPLAERHPSSAVWAQPGRHDRAVALLPSAAGRQELVTIDPLGRLALRDAGTGAILRRPVSGHVVKPVAVATVNAGLLLALDQDGSLHLLPLGDELHVPAGVERLTSELNAVALGTPNGRLTAVATHADRVAVADDQGVIQLWSMTDHQAPASIAHPHQTPITAVGCLTLSQAGTVLILTGAMDGTVRLWESAGGEVMPPPVERRPAIPTALAVADTAVGPVLAVAWSDRQLHLWLLFEGRMRPIPLLYTADALALAADGTLIVAGGEGTTALRLNLDTLWA